VKNAGSFTLGSPNGTVLEIICILMGLEYEIKDNGKISGSKKHK